MFSTKLGFEMVLACDLSEVQERIQKKLAQKTGPCTGTILRQHVMLRMREELQHYWSPVLNIDLEAVETGTRLKGNFGPHPNVWGLFVVVYSVLLLSATFGLMLGFSQILVKEAPWGFWLAPAALVLALGLYGAAQVGQKLAAEQMGLMRRFFDDSVCDSPLDFGTLKN